MIVKNNVRILKNNMIQETTSQRYERLEKQGAGKGYMTAAAEIMQVNKQLREIDPTNGLLTILGATCDDEISLKQGYPHELYRQLSPEMVPVNRNLSLLEEAGLYVDLARQEIKEARKS